MPTARNKWVAQQTGFPGQFGAGRFQAWKAQQGGNIAATDWPAAYRRHLAQPKRVVAAPIAPTRIRMLTAKELLKKRNDTWKNADNAMSIRVTAYKKANNKARSWSAAGVTQKIRAWDASGTVANINKTYQHAIDAYDNNKNRLTAEGLKAAVSLRQGRKAATKAGRTSARKFADAKALKNSMGVEIAGRAALADAFSKGLVGRDKGGFLNDAVSFGTSIAIPAALAFGGLVTGVGALGALSASAGAASGGVDIAATGSGMLATDVTGLATMASASEAQAIIAGQALANSIGAGLTGAAAQAAAAAAITQAGVGSLAAGALAAVPTLSVGTAAATSNIVGSIFSQIKDSIGKEITRITDQVTSLNVGTLTDKAATTVVGIAGTTAAAAIAPAVTHQSVPVPQVVAPVPATPAATSTAVQATTAQKKSNNNALLYLAMLTAVNFG